jgi:geranylgeranyl reductase family protein
VSAQLPTGTDVLVVGAGPAGSAAAAWSARAGREVVLADAAVFPRDKTCGDGLTPRAMGELDQLGLGEWARGRAVNRGLRLTGWGRETELPWPDGALPQYGSAVPRTELDDTLRATAVADGAQMLQGVRAVAVARDGDRVQSVTFDTTAGPHEVRCRTLVVADGVRSPVGKMLGRTWHREHAYGVAARAYIDSDRSDDQWITSHLELRDDAGALQPGYGWVFPLGADRGEVNIGVGTLSTAKRPAKVQLRPLLDRYVAQRRTEWGMTGRVHHYASALLPMGGAVSGVSGRNWALIGDAAACVNPLNGEGIDYGLEGGRLLATMLDEPDLTHAWSELLRREYGRAFSIARRLAALTTLPHTVGLGGPPVVRSMLLMRILIRVMGNLVTDHDADLVSRAWRAAGAASLRIDTRLPFA